MFISYATSKRKIFYRLAMIVIFLGSLMPFTSLAYAETLCVKVDGSGSCHTLVSTAVNAAANNDTIRVYPGTYYESGTINISKTGLKIIGDNPINTKVINLGAGNVFTVSADLIEIAGLTITGPGHGIAIGWSAGDDIAIHHNHINYNGQRGINSSSSGTTFTAYHNIIGKNGDYGIFSASSSSFMHSNIVYHNTVYGIRGGTASYNSSFGHTNNYSTSGNIENLEDDCLFYDEANPDYRLKNDTASIPPQVSPCINKGNPLHFDADGTRSDMGSFGGAGAALFWPYLDVGPVITDLTVDPVIVPRGGSLSISVTG